MLGWIIKLEIYKSNKEVALDFSGKDDLNMGNNEGTLREEM